MDNTVFGLPYAMIDVDTGASICPECGERYPEDYDATGEQTTNNYAEHYAQKHS